MINVGYLIIREYPMAQIPTIAMQDLLSLFEGLICFEATVADVDVPDNPHDMAIVMEEVLVMVETAVICYMDNRPVGLMMIDKGSPYAIAALFVVEDARSKGVGELLVGWLQSRYPLQELTVDCYKGNTRALSFYRRLGFEFTESPLIMKGTRKVR